MSNQGDGQGQHRPEDGQQPNDQPQQGRPGNAGAPQPGQSGGHRLPGQSGPQRSQADPGGQQPWTGGQPPQTGGQPPQPPQGNPGGQQPWTGGQPPLTGGQQPPWSSGGQQAQPPSWSTGETGPNVGPTMNNPQSSYYDRFSEASGEGVVVPPKGGGGGGRGKALIGVAAALVVVIAAVAIFALTRGDDTKPTEASTPSSSSLPPVTATTWVNPTLAAGSRALKSGWQAQTAGGDPPGVFDVPKNDDWTLESKDTYFGYADSNGKPLVLAHAPARFAVGYCSAKKTAESAWIGIVNIGKRDPSDAGPDVAQKFADAIALKKDGSHAQQGKLSAAKQVKVNQGTVPALEYTITTKVGDPDDCDKGKTYEVRTVTFSAAGKSYQLVTIRLLDAPKGKQLSEKLLDEIITTFRPGS